MLYSVEVPLLRCDCSYFIYYMNKHKLYRYALDWVFPNICPSCGEQIGYDEAFCDECLNELILYEGDFSVKNADSFTAYCIYDHTVSRILNRFKYDPCGNSYYAFAFGIMQALRRNRLSGDFDIIVSIPMEKSDYNARGYNQTELIADELHFLMDKPHIKALKKVRRTEPQKSLDGEKRRLNMIDAFNVENELLISDKRVLVIDDLCTTGSTLSEAARAIRKGGARTVLTATFAKTTLDK